MISSIIETENEVVSLQDAYIYLKTIREYTDRLTISIIKEAHSFIIYENYGEFSQKQRIAYFKEEYFEYCKPKDIEKELTKLLDDNNIQPYEFLRKFLQIHPFPDGNGRLAKLLYCFLTNKCIIWKDQGKYIKALRKSDTSLQEYLNHLYFLNNF